MRQLNSEQVRALGWAAAVSAVRSALEAGAVERAVPRSRFDVPAGHLLLMPAADDRYIGVKLAGVRSAGDGPRITGSYVLLDAASMQPVALLDAAALTAVRTPAVSAMALALVGCTDVRRAVVIGTGVQAAAHAAALAALHPGADVVVVGRSTQRAGDLVRQLLADGAHRARVGALDDAESADVVVTATSSARPVLGLADVRPPCVVVSVGVHEPDRHELSPDLVRGSVVVADDAAEAARSNGNLVLAPGAEVAAGFQDLVHGVGLPNSGLFCVLSAGAAWQDLAVAGAVLDRG